MINNSFYINVWRGTVGGCRHARQILLYILGYWLNREGDFRIKYYIIFALLTFSQTEYKVIL